MDETENNTPEEEMEIAQAALAAGDPQHAVYHIAGALAADPLRRDRLAVLDRIIEAEDRPTRLAPVKDGASFAVVAVHAYIQARLRRYDRAIGLLLQVFAVRPEIPYLAWAAAWLRKPGVAKRFDLVALNGGILNILDRFPGTVLDDEADRLALEGLVPLVGPLLEVWNQLVSRPRPVLPRRFAPRRPRQTRPDPEDSGVFLFFLSSVLRKVGRLDAALRLAEESYRQVPCTPTAIARALALAALGRVDEAVAAYRATMRFDPTDVAGLLDAAELLWQHERLDEAEHLYEEIFRRSPDDPRAMPVYCYLRYFSSEFDPSWLERLRDFVDDHPEHPQGREILGRMTPYFGYLPSPPDAFVKMLHQLAESMANTPPEPGPSTLKYRVDSPEAPSNRLALAMLSKRYDHPIELDASVETIPEPDPRQPLGRVWYQLWRYEGTEPIPVLPPPPDDVAQAVAAIAAGDYDRSAWAASAARLGAAMGPSRVDELLGVMVHPPLALDPFTPWDWIQRIQLAAAMAAAGLDEGWAGSLRRKVLISLVNGPMDWSVSAAIVALAGLAATDPAIAAEALAVFRARLHSLPDRGQVCYAVPLILAMLELPGVTPAERAELKAKLRELSQ